MATYVNDLRLKEITPGDEDGTWGTSTNTNWDIVAEAWGTGTLQFAADANETFTMADGVTSEVRSAFITVTSAGTLTATRTLTLAPSTLNKVWWFKNSTTGGQSIIIKQGSGATVTIATGIVKFLSTDGAGAGAAVTERETGSFGTMSTQNANAVAITGGAITGGTITGITDLAVADGGTGASTAANARTNLGLGTIATQAASAVAITGGTITGITDLAVADGGTGASTAAAARTNLGGTTAGQAFFTLTNPSAITFPRVNADNTVTALTDSLFRTAIGLGSMATQNANNVAITGGSVTNTTLGLIQATANISAGTLTLDLGSASYFIVTVSQNFAVALSNVPSGRPVYFTVEFGNTGSFDFTTSAVSGYTVWGWEGKTINLKPSGTTLITGCVRGTNLFLWCYWMNAL